MKPFEGKKHRAKIEKLVRKSGTKAQKKAQQQIWAQLAESHARASEDHDGAPVSCGFSLFSSQRKRSGSAQDSWRSLPGFPLKYKAVNESVSLVYEQLVGSIVELHMEYSLARSQAVQQGYLEESRIHEVAIDATRRLHATRSEKPAGKHGNPQTEDLDMVEEDAQDGDGGGRRRSLLKTLNLHDYLMLVANDFVDWKLRLAIEDMLFDGREDRARSFHAIEGRLRGQYDDLTQPNPTDLALEAIINAVPLLVASCIHAVLESGLEPFTTLSMALATPPAAKASGGVSAGEGLATTDMPVKARKLSLIAKQHEETLLGRLKRKLSDGSITSNAGLHSSVSRGTVDVQEDEDSGEQEVDDEEDLDEHLEEDLLGSALPSSIPSPKAAAAVFPAPERSKEDSQMERILADKSVDSTVEGESRHRHFDQLSIGDRSASPASPRSGQEEMHSPNRKSPRSQSRKGFNRQSSRSIDVAHLSIGSQDGGPPGGVGDVSPTGQRQSSQRARSPGHRGSKSSPSAHRSKGRPASSRSLVQRRSLSRERVTTLSSSDLRDLADKVADGLVAARPGASAAPPGEPESSSATPINTPPARPAVEGEAVLLSPTTTKSPAQSLEEERKRVALLFRMHDLGLRIRRKDVGPDPAPEDYTVKDVVDALLLDIGLDDDEQRASSVASLLQGHGDKSQHVTLDAFLAWWNLETEAQVVQQGIAGPSTSPSRTPRSGSSSDQGQASISKGEKDGGGEDASPGLGSMNPREVKQLALVCVQALQSLIDKAKDGNGRSDGPSAGFSGKERPDKVQIREILAPKMAEALKEGIGLQSIELQSDASPRGQGSPLSASPPEGDSAVIAAGGEWASLSAERQRLLVDVATRTTDVLYETYGWWNRRPPLPSSSSSSSLNRTSSPHSNRRTSSPRRGAGAKPTGAPEDAEEEEEPTTFTTAVNEAVVSSSKCASPLESLEKSLESSFANCEFSEAASLAVKMKPPTSSIEVPARHRSFTNGNGGAKRAIRRTKSSTENRATPPLYSSPSPRSAAGNASLPQPPPGAGSRSGGGLSPSQPSRKTPPIRRGITVTPSRPVSLSPAARRAGSLSVNTSVHRPRTASPSPTPHGAAGGLDQPVSPVQPLSGGRLSLDSSLATSYRSTSRPGSSLGRGRSGSPPVTRRKTQIIQSQAQGGSRVITRVARSPGTSQRLSYVQMAANAPRRGDEGQSGSSAPSPLVSPSSSSGLTRRQSYYDAVASVRGGSGNTRDGDEGAAAAPRSGPGHRARNPSLDSSAFSTSSRRAPPPFRTKSTSSYSSAMSTTSSLTVTVTNSRSPYATSSISPAKGGWVATPGTPC